MRTILLLQGEAEGPASSSSEASRWATAGAEESSTLGISRDAAGGKPGAKPSYGASYYKGLVTNDLQQDNAASGSDMLNRSMQLAGGMAMVLAVLTAAFLKSNGAL